MHVDLLTLFLALLGSAIMIQVEPRFRRWRHERKPARSPIGPLQENNRHEMATVNNGERTVQCMDCGKGVISFFIYTDGHIRCFPCRNARVR